MKKFEGILLISDMDNTLLSGAEISEKNRAAIEYFKENGGLFTVATGRAPYFIQKYGKLTNAPAAVINGTVIYDLEKNEMLWECIMDKKHIDAARYAAENMPIERVIFYSMKDTFFHFPKKEDFDGYDEDLHKLVFVYSNSEDAIAACKQFSALYGNVCNVERSWPEGVELSDIRAGKGKCVEKLKEMTGASVVVAAGDYENDRSLLAAADISYAPENALDEIKAIADYVVADAMDGAIADIINRLEKDIEEKRRGKNE